MPEQGYLILKCTWAECGLRYPMVKGHSFGRRCPACGAETRPVHEGFLSPEPARQPGQGRSSGLEAMLDNVRSAWNVGSMLRTAEGLALDAIYLCGFSPTPDHPKVSKTALGAEESIPWRYFPDGQEAAVELRRSGRRLWALESGVRSIRLSEASGKIPGPPIVLVVGNELTGVDPAILEQCDQVIEIPMLGAKRSFNAAVAFGIAAWKLRQQR